MTRRSLLGLAERKYLHCLFDIQLHAPADVPTPIFQHVGVLQGHAGLNTCTSTCMWKLCFVAVTSHVPYTLLSKRWFCAVTFKAIVRPQDVSIYD